MRTITLAMAILLSFTAFAREAKVSTNQPKPLSFIENKGQITDQNTKARKDIDVKLETPGMSVFVGDGAIHYQWYKQTSTSETSPSAPLKGGTLKQTQKRENVNVETYRMDVELVGANKNAEVVLEEKQEYYETYYLSQFPEGALVHSYNKITYKNVYPGIDWILYSRNNQLKYDFVVQAGADPKQIQLKYNGATQMVLEDGALKAVTPYGNIIEAAPYSYDAANGQPIATNYVLKENVLSFSATVLDRKFVIDPILNWGTYYGGAAEEFLSSLATDTAGNVLAAGRTESTTNVATIGAFQQSLSDSVDGFLAKFSSAGVRVWATYYGGSGNDAFYSVACNAAGDVYAGGKTTSNGMATAGAHQTAYTSYEDGILVKFNSAGQRQWASYYGAVGDDVILTLALDQAGVLYIAGTTDAGGGAIAPTPGAFQTTGGGSFIARFSAAGIRQWGTYFGADTYIYSIATDLFGNIYATGGTGYYANLGTPGAYQPGFLTPGIGQWEGFLVKFNSSGARLWGTYYGGSSSPSNSVISHSVATDNAGNAYICGTTAFANSTIVTTGAHQTTLGGSHDGFLAKFNPAGVRLWGTYYGGSSWDWMGSLDVGPDGNIYIIGTTLSTTNIATSGSHQPNWSGGYDDFLVVFDPAGVRQWATYYGGAAYDQSAYIFYGDYGKLVTCSNKGAIYFGGHTHSGNGIATPGAYQTTNAGDPDAFIAQFQMDHTLFLLNPSANLQLCKGDTMTVSYGVSASFASGNVFTLQLSNNSGSFAAPTTLATVSGIQSGTVKIPVPFSVANGSGYRIRVVSSNPAKISADNGIDIHISNYPAKPVATATNPICTGQDLAFTVATQTGVSWSWTGPNSFTSGIQNPSINNVTTAASGDYIVTAELAGCARKDTVNVTVGIMPAKPTANNNSPICAGATLSLTSTTTTPGVSWSWAGPMGYSSTQQNPNIIAATPGHAGDYVVTASLGDCHAKDTTTAIINNVSSIGAYVSPNDTFCAGTQASFVAVPFNGGASPTFQWYKNGAPISGATSLVYSTSGAVTGDSFYCRMIATGICTDPLELYSPGIKITVLPVSSTPTVTISSNPVVPQPGQLTAFTATAVNGGPTPTYQWLRNGQLVAGATGANWSASTLHPYDKISCVVFSSDVCANPKTDTSSTIIVNFPTTIKNIDSKNWQVYPNPATNELTVEGEAGMQVSILNILGQEVYSGILNTSKEVINISQLAPGNYILQLTGSDGVRNTVKVTKQ